MITRSIVIQTVRILHRSQANNGFPPLTCIRFVVNNKFFSTNENLTNHNDNDHNVIIDETMIDTNNDNNNNSNIVVLKEKIRHTKVKDSQKFPPMNIHKAVELVKELSWAKFDESVEISLNLGLDPRKPNQSVKGVASLPYGTGKVVRVCVFALGNQAKEAKAAGADLVGGEELVAQIQAGNINFDTFIATPETMIFVGKLGRILGPRGLMPNPKLGTVTKDVAKAVLASKAGAVKFKVEKKGIIQAAVGKVSFTNEALLGNIRAFMLAVIDVKPEGLKGKYLLVAHISSTMGPGIQVQVPSVDPGSQKFMLDISATTMSSTVTTSTTPAAVT